jgi:tRNA threonylcarbamoyladenosine biosynthesis protein TsaB
MALILNIDTATTIGSVCLARDGRPLQTMVNEKQQDHAATMALFVKEILATQEVTPDQLDAIAISAGPGSYTGLRVGVATAKGLCYAWGKPLLAISTLQMMAQGASSELLDEQAYYCPMLDARRQEVYTAIYDYAGHDVKPPSALILTPDAFHTWLEERKIYFFGDGSTKWQQLMKPHQHAVFVPYNISATHMTLLSEAAFEQQHFADIAYFSPFYLKPFYFPAK